jgi:hypothetical protein
VKCLRRTRHLPNLTLITVAGFVIL